jgi:ABC-type multidrug transport system fused ATPase/permease subunit
MFHRQDQIFTEERKAQSVGATLRRLGRYFRPYSFILLIIAAVVIISTYMQVLVPDLTGQLVDCYLTPYAANATMEQNVAAGLNLGQLTGQAAGEATPPSSATAGTPPPIWQRPRKKQFAASAFSC